MKKTIAAVMALVLCMMAGGAALAEAPDADEAAFEETEEERESFLSWIGQGAELLSDAISDGWEMAGDAVSSGLDWMQGKITDWSSRAEDYMKKHEWDKKTEEAWNTLKEGAVHQGEIAGEQLEEAYDTVRRWLVSSGDTVDQAVADAVDGMAGAAGVAEARLSGWYRKMEAYMVEKSDLVTEAAGKAWETVKEYARDAGSVTEEQLDQACDTLRDWLNGIGEDGESEALQGLDLLTKQE